ncbi:hypothetical protein LCGC14_2907170, partial [marine sediment metagenome]
LTTSEADYDLHSIIEDEKAFVSGDRIVVKVYGRNDSATARNVTIYMEGDTAARVEFPALLNVQTVLWEVDGTETQLKTADEIDMQTKKIINVVDPTANQEAATKKYVDDSTFWDRAGTTLSPTTAGDNIETTGTGTFEGLTVNGTLQMGNDDLIAVDVNAGLTASTTQEQGQGALTAQVNEISTVANNGDTVTLPAAVTGVECEIINNGANTIKIFPASGDDLGLGTGATTSFEELEANERVKFVAYDTTNWAKESTTEIIHAEIHDEDNTDPFVINDAGGDFHSYHTNGLAAGDLADWTFDAGGAGTSHAITGIVQAGSDITVTTGTAHGLAIGDIISQTNLTNAAYVGVFDVLTVPTTTTYTVTAAYTATGTGTMDQAATLEA